MAEGRTELDHATIRELLSESLDGLIRGRDREDVAAHLGACASCRAFGHGLACTVALVRQLPRARLPVAARGRLMARLDAAVRTPVGV
jgi:predicted anti-sigma-YlaC factor YlaD